MTFWPSTSYSDFPTNQTFHQFHDLDSKLDLHRIRNGFQGAFATDVACQQGTLTPTDTLFRPPFWRLAYARIVETSFSELAVSFLNFSPVIPLGTFSILLQGQICCLHGEPQFSKRACWMQMIFHNGCPLSWPLIKFRSLWSSSHMMEIYIWS